MLYVLGVGEAPISISGNPLEPAPLTHTVRAVGAVSRAICALKRGTSLGVRGPFGAGWPMDEARGRDVVIVAGGIGLAPLRPAVCQIMAQRQHYGRVCLLVGARTPKDLLYSAELMQWRARFDLEVLVTVDSASNGWRGHVGVVTTLIDQARFDPEEALALVCGPEVMMRYTISALQRVGVAEEHVYLSVERNMKCALGFCGHCQLGPTFVCKDGPVFHLPGIAPFLKVREV